MSQHLQLRSWRCSANSQPVPAVSCSPPGRVDFCSGVRTRTFLAGRRGPSSRDTFISGRQQESKPGRVVKDSGEHADKEGGGRATATGLSLTPKRIPIRAVPCLGSLSCLACRCLPVPAPRSCLHDRAVGFLHPGQMGWTWRRVVPVRGPGLTFPRLKHTIPSIGHEESRRGCVDHICTFLLYNYAYEVYV
ncbi:hypothetical protein LX36DRAFT_224141 [Colletotrichum falcatum]|nr:hypothetical protein LX36DRAFT_224141 [Colletotrichum falcatum]